MDLKRSLKKKKPPPTTCQICGPDAARSLFAASDVYSRRKLTAPAVSIDSTLLFSLFTFADTTIAIRQGARETFF